MRSGEEADYKNGGKEDEKERGDGSRIVKEPLHPVHLFGGFSNGADELDV